MGGRQLEKPVQVKVFIHNQLTTYENSGSLRASSERVGSSFGEKYRKRLIKRKVTQEAVPNVQTLVPIADKLFDQHLKELEMEGRT